MYQKLLLFFIILVMCCRQRAGAQNYRQRDNFLKANSVWVFGTGGGLDLNTASPTSLFSSIYSVEGSASVADSTGQLLFYLGNNTIYNSNHIPMPNGAGLYPSAPNLPFEGGTSTQGALIIPVIDTPWKYYVFTNMHVQAYAVSEPPPYLAYSVVDMTLAGGLGDIEPGRKNIPLESSQPLAEGMIAIPGDHCDIWLLTHTSTYARYPTTEHSFMAWHITPAGIDPNPVRSSSTSMYSDGGQIAVSPDRSKIALANVMPPALHKTGVLLGKFNPATGEVADVIVIASSLRSYGVCFSPNSKRLYVSLPAETPIYQFDVSVHDAASIDASRLTINNLFISTSGYGTLKLYKDTIYAGRRPPSSIFSPKDTIARINNPNGRGVLCDFEPGAIALLPGTGSFFGGLPNDVVYPLAQQDQVSVVRKTMCYTEASGYSSLTLQAPEGFAFYQWDNGSVDNTREVAAPGTHWVRYYNNRCQYYIDTFHVQATDLTFSLGEDRMVLLCDHPESYLQLKAGIPLATYLWQDGSSANQYKVTRPGTYWLEVSKEGCTASDTITIAGVESPHFSDTTVTLCKGDPVAIDLMLHAPEVPSGTLVQWSTGSSAPLLHVTDTGWYWLTLVHPPCILTDSAYIKVDLVLCQCFTLMPNAFSPNGDGTNDVFTPVIEAGCPVKNYAFSIYNRFGERIFHSSDPLKGWDGYHKGIRADAGTYFYELSFKGGKRELPYYKKGDVLLIM